MGHPYPYTSEAPLPAPAGPHPQAESGQAAVLTAVAMLAVLMVTAFAIDLTSWYQQHHQAQVAADSAALAAANCLADGRTTTVSGGLNCTSATDTTDAISVANEIATTNLPGSSDLVNVNTTAHTITVTASSHPAVDFAGMAGISPTVSARSVASYVAPTANYSLFVGDPSCTSSGLQIASDGGGNAAVTGLFSDAVVNNADHSGSANYSGGISDGQSSGGYQAGVTPLCGDGQGTAGSGGNQNSWQTKNTTLAVGQELPYPEQYSEPLIGTSTITGTEPNSPPAVIPGTCTFASTYFSTDGSGIHGIDYPGIYCVVDSAGNIATSHSGTCSSLADDTAGSIYVGSTLEGSPGFELVGPCVVGNGYMSSSIGAINSMTPLIYGTAQSSSPCLDPSTGMVNPGAVAASDNVYLANNNLVLNGPIYAPCGTVELTGNSNFAAFVEAANVTLDKNNTTTWTGTGPPMAAGGDALTN
jgi:Flp pilus assembly protein TadG